MEAEYMEMQREQSEYESKVMELSNELDSAELAVRAPGARPTRADRLRLDLAVAKLDLFYKYDFESNGYDCPPNRQIKGNKPQSLDGDKIYHLPNWLYYGPTIPEACFKTVAQARGEGYRPSQVRD
ncbi:hypothetical protein [Nocardioides aestuarii]|uniref:DUF899 domain-containing protein n=1 Tax=Nocardioides aestuarii TaxID=252231 RepID=A0ABW4THE2_9ACTN